MKSLNNISRVYFIGIGGIGMSALARYFNLRGCTVSGYDKVKTPLTEELNASGIDIHYDINLDKIDREAEWIIYTPAIPNDHEELKYFMEHSYSVFKRSEALEKILESYKAIAIAGTHGKTTVTSMVSYILKECDQDITAFIGGIATNFNSNFLYGKSDFAVAEADEYDRSFLRMHPAIAVITATDADHLDIYSDHDNLKESFNAFAAQIIEDGLLIHKYGLDVQAKVEKKTYHLADERADYHCSSISIRGGKFFFDLISPYGKMTELTLRQAGYHNVENAIAAIAIAQYLKIDNDRIKMALSEFTGIKRRFEYLHDSEDFIMIDDYAHHPKEVEVFLKSVREMYPNKKVTAVFQPHLYSRTQDFYKGFAESLSLADALILLDIYPAREEAIEGVTSKLIFDSVELKEKYLCEKRDLLEHIKGQEYDVFCTIGAGDIDLMLDEIKNTLIETNN